MGFHARRTKVTCTQLQNLLGTHRQLMLQCSPDNTYMTLLPLVCNIRKRAFLEFVVSMSVPGTDECAKIFEDLPRISWDRCRGGMEVKVLNRKVKSGAGAAWSSQLKPFGVRSLLIPDLWVPPSILPSASLCSNISCLRLPSAALEAPEAKSMTRLSF